jgi:hypothetical protein
MALSSFTIIASGGNTTPQQTGNNKETQKKAPTQAPQASPNKTVEALKLIGKAAVLAAQTYCIAFCIDQINRANNALEADITGLSARKQNKYTVAIFPRAKASRLFSMIAIPTLLYAAYGTVRSLPTHFKNVFGRSVQK